MTMQPIAPGTEIRCPLCQVIMTYKPKLHMWECPITTCRLQVWPPMGEPDYKTAEQMFNDCARHNGMIRRSGGDKGPKRKRARKHPTEAPPWDLTNPESAV